MGSASSGHRGWHQPDERDMCGSCGVVAYPGEMFCVSCGAYLGWDTTGRNRAVRPEPAPATGPDPLFAQPTSPPAPPTARPQPWNGPPEPAPPADARVLEPSPAAAPWSDYPGYAAPVPEPTAAYPRVITGELVLQTAPYEHTHAVADTPPIDLSHLLLCPECREPNAESRTYCHPCGALLRPEPEPPVPTRWERLRQEYVERPEVWHWDRRWNVLLAALPVCLVAGVSMGSVAAAAERAVPLVKDRFLAQHMVAPESVSASSSAKGFGPDLASDGVDNKAWAPQGSGQDVVGEYWTATFQAPFRLTSLVIVNGASKTPGQFFEAGRPTKITVTATTTDLGVVEKTINLGDQPGPQRFDLGIDGVTALEVRIAAVNPGLKPRMPVAMAEIQFFSRQAS
ncbi:NADase-type glycan-binding domain-containing protein [Streptomyces sp. WZ-12]|uniref:NADase-type glycan-binding domain-containing protein n=1 Tax=Streptomyces sp. WZ-12 TaxID=3030210 RepID=UPI0023815ACC|nr:hypothetical protein [Streptomyces sp. WZ-12]